MTSPALTGEEALTPDLFRKFCAIAYQKGGIQLKEGKEPLVAARVGKRLRALGIEDIRDYMRILEEDDSGEELVQFLDAISTNFTSFFREPEHFDFLADSVKRWTAAGQRHFRFWSAASSSGEEPYSIVITLLEAFGGERIEFKLLATDISTRVLNQALAGVYDAKKVESIPAALRARYFVTSGRRSDEAGLQYEAAPALKERIVFKRLNLATPPFPMTGPLDVVFCRNVMIYFDQRVRQSLISEAERLLKPGGILMIGHTETLTGISNGLTAIRPSMYRKPERG